MDSRNFVPLEPKNVKSVTDETLAKSLSSTTASAVKLLALPDPYEAPKDFTFCGVYVVTVFLLRTGMIIADVVGVVSPELTVTTGGFEYSPAKETLSMISTL